MGQDSHHTLSLYKSFAYLNCTVESTNYNLTYAVHLQLHQNEFNVSAALHDLYQYAVKYNDHVRRAAFSIAVYLECLSKNI